VFRNSSGHNRCPWEREVVESQRFQQELSRGEHEVNLAQRTLDPVVSALDPRINSLAIVPYGSFRCPGSVGKLGGGSPAALVQSFEEELSVLWHRVKCAVHGVRRNRGWQALRQPMRHPLQWALAMAIAVEACPAAASVHRQAEIAVGMQPLTSAWAGQPAVVEVECDGDCATLRFVQKAQREPREGLDCEELGAKAVEDVAKHPIEQGVVERFGQIAVGIVLDESKNIEAFNALVFHAVLREAGAYAAGDDPDFNPVEETQRIRQSGGIHLDPSVGIRQECVGHKEHTPRFTRRHRLNKVPFRLEQPCPRFLHA